MKAPHPPPADLGPPGSSRSSILHWVRNKNSQEDLYLRNVLEYHQRELVLRMLKLEEDRLDWQEFLRKLKLCNSDDLSEFAGLVSDRLSAVKDEQEGQGAVRRLRRTRFRDLFSEEEIAAIPLLSPEGAGVRRSSTMSLGGAGVRRSSTVPDLLFGSRRTSNTSLMERFHTDTQIQHRAISTVAEETGEPPGSPRQTTRPRPSPTTPGEADELPGIRGTARPRPSLTTPGILTDIQPHIPEEHTQVRESESTLCLPIIGHLQDSPEKHVASKISASKILSQSLPNLSRNPTQISKMLPLKENNGDHKHVPGNQKENVDSELEFTKPELKQTKPRRKKPRRQVSLVNRIDDFFKKLEEFETRSDLPLVPEGAGVELPPVNN